MAIVVGSEGKGLGPAVRRRCDLLVRIPMHGRIDSLNAAVAGSILLYEAAAQRGTGRRPDDGAEDARSVESTVDAATEPAPEPDAEPPEAAEPADADKADEADVPDEIAVVAEAASEPEEAASVPDDILPGELPTGAQEATDDAEEPPDGTPSDAPAEPPEV